MKSINKFLFLCLAVFVFFAISSVAYGAKDKVTAIVTAPGQITNSGACSTTATGTISVFWTAVSDPSAKYELVDIVNGVETLIYSGSKNSYDHKDVAIGATHIYKVRSLSGGKYSSYLTSLSRTIYNCPILTVTNNRPAAIVTSSNSGAIDGTISCGATCAKSYGFGSKITVTAPAQTGYSIVISGGGCSVSATTGNQAVCSTIDIRQDETVKVEYALAPAQPVPVLTTTACSSITQNTATSGGNITSIGGSAVSARGVVWNKVGSPTTDIIIEKTNNGPGGTGVFTSSLTNLSAGTTYYVRAFATNLSGTGYGNQVLCATPGIIPTLNNPTYSNVTCNSATLGATVVTLGNPASITARGVCYRAYGTPARTGPDYAFSTCVPATGTTTGAFTVNIPNLSSGTGYSFIGYADHASAPGTTSPSVAFSTSSSCPPASVTNFQVAPSSCSNKWIGLTWNAVPGATSYQIYRNGGPAVEASTLYGYNCDAVTSKCKGSDDKNLNRGDYYSYAIRATNAGGSSAQVESIPSMVAVPNYCRVTFDKNNTTVGSTLPDPTFLEALNYNTSVGLPKPPTQPGYDFSSWNRQQDGNGLKFDGSTLVNSIYTVFAQWIPFVVITHKVTFDGNGSTSGSMSPQIFNEQESKNLTANNFQKTGNTFDSWNTSSNGNGIKYANQAIFKMGTFDVTLYAQWKPSAVTTYELKVTIDGNGVVTSSPNASEINCGSDCSQFYNTGTQVTLVPTGVVDSWIGCTSMSGNNCIVNMNSDKTVTAKFKNVAVSNAQPWLKVSSPSYDNNKEADSIPPVKFNSIVTLHWGLEPSTTGTSCYLSGQGFGGITNGVVNTINTKNTNPLKKTETFTIECDGNGKTDQVTVQVLPLNPDWNEN